MAEGASMCFSRSKGVPLFFSKINLKKKITALDKGPLNTNCTSLMSSDKEFTIQGLFALWVQFNREGLKEIIRVNY